MAISYNRLLWTLLKYYFYIRIEVMSSIYQAIKYKCNSRKFPYENASRLNKIPKEYNSEKQHEDTRKNNEVSTILHPQSRVSSMKNIIKRHEQSNKNIAENICRRNNSEIKNDDSKINQTTIQGNNLTVNKQVGKKSKVVLPATVRKLPESQILPARLGNFGIN